MSNIMLDIETLGTRSTKVQHDALDDAVAQAMTLQALLNYVKEGSRYEETRRG